MPDPYARQHVQLWHPLQAAVEGPVGTWRMIDTLGREYGVVRLVRLDGEPRYRAEHQGELIGYGGTLRSAVERVHMAHVRAAEPGGRGEYPHHTPNPRDRR